jgi:hypothetical protein
VNSCFLENTSIFYAGTPSPQSSSKASKNKGAATPAVTRFAVPAKDFSETLASAALRLDVSVAIGGLGYTVHLGAARFHALIRRDSVLQACCSCDFGGQLERALRRYACSL